MVLRRVELPPEGMASGMKVISVFGDNYSFP
jgi:hypothetical protein